MHGGRGVQAHCLANFTHAGRVTPLLHAVFNDVEDLALAFGEGFRHVCERTGVRGPGQTPVRGTNVRWGVDTEHLFGQTYEHPFVTVSLT